jgi:hypothetical protein
MLNGNYFVQFFLEMKYSITAFYKTLQPPTPPIDDIAHTVAESGWGVKTISNCFESTSCRYLRELIKYFKFSIYLRNVDYTYSLSLMQ